MTVGELILELNRKMNNKEIKPTDKVFIPDDTLYYDELKVIAVNPADQDMRGVYFDVSAG
jgi:hypothetical protein